MLIPGKCSLCHQKSDVYTCFPSKCVPWLNKPGPVVEELCNTCAQKQWSLLAPGTDAYDGYIILPVEQDSELKREYMDQIELRYKYYEMRDENR